MSDRLSRGSGQRNDDVMAAIFELVERPDQANGDEDPNRYRPQALRELDVPTTVDNLLQLTSRRLWISIAAAALVVAALLWYSATTVRVEAVPATGRAVAPPGVGTVISPREGVITDVLVSPGQVIQPGQSVAAMVAADGTAVDVTAAVSGQVWQVTVHPGAAVSTGQQVVGLVPPDSGSEIMLAVPESDAAGVVVGQRVDVAVDDSGPSTGGSVVAVSSAPVPAAVAADTLAVAAVSEEPVTLVTVATDSAVPSGSAVQASIVQSERTLLEQLLGLR